MPTTRTALIIGEVVIRVVSVVIGLCLLFPRFFAAGDPIEAMMNPMNWIPLGFGFVLLLVGLGDWSDPDLPVETAGKNPA